MKEKIIRLLEDKINDVYIEMQNELDIGDGFISPSDSFNEDKKVRELAEIIEKVLQKQNEEIYITSSNNEMILKTETTYTLTTTHIRHQQVLTAYSVVQELGHLFDGVNKEYMNKLFDALDILQDIVNEEGKFTVEYTDL